MTSVRLPDMALAVCVDADTWMIISQEDEERGQCSKSRCRREGTAQETAKGGARTEHREEESSCWSEEGEG